MRVSTVTDLPIAQPTDVLQRFLMGFKVTKTQHVLAVDDFEGAVAYFTEKLGFTEYNRVGGWSFLQLGEFWLMVGDCQGEVPARDTGNHSWFAYVNCEGIDDLHRQYVARG